MLGKWWMVTMTAKMQWQDNHAAGLGWEEEPTVGHAVARGRLVAAGVGRGALHCRLCRGVLHTQWLHA
jgi:hypothetical protein